MVSSVWRASSLLFVLCTTPGLHGSGSPQATRRSREVKTGKDLRYSHKRVLSNSLNLATRMEARSGQFLLDLPHYEICSRSGSDASSNTAAVWVHGGLQYMFGGRDFGGGDSLPFFPLLVVFRELGSLGFAVKHLQWCCLGCAKQEHVRSGTQELEMVATKFKL